MQRPVYVTSPKRARQLAQPQITGYGKEEGDPTDRRLGQRGKRCRELWRWRVRASPETSHY
jgi:hypothetical protein